MTTTPLLRAARLHKQFGGLTALQNISLEVGSGEVVGLAGRGGDGITTLISILSGALKPDHGTLTVDGTRMQWPFRTHDYGMGVIHQRVELADRLDITSNIFLGNERGWPLFGRWLSVPDQERMDQEAARIVASLGAPFKSLHKRASDLSTEERQLVAVAQVMARPVKLVLVDDQTVALSLPYQEKLLEIVRDWQRRRVAVLYNSKNLDHLFAVCDRIIVLRQGRVVANARTDETDRERLVAAMVGTTDRQQRTPAIWALDSYYRARRQAELLRHNQNLLKRDLAAQDLLNQQLVEQLANQVRALDSANLALQDAQRRLLTERDQERKRLAREIHDQAIQDLLSLNYDLEEIGERLQALPDLEVDMAEVRQHVRGLVEELRRICGNLRPPTIDSLGLGAALQSYTRDWSERTGIAVRLEMDTLFGRLPEEIELSIFRIVQEGLSNVRKHADATAVDISLRPTSPRMLLVSIADNGHGLDKSFDLGTMGRDGHYGLLGISERVALMGGRLRFENQPGGGLLLQVEIPHPRLEERERG